VVGGGPVGRRRGATTGRRSRARGRRVEGNEGLPSRGLVLSVRRHP